MKVVFILCFVFSLLYSTGNQKDKQKCYAGLSPDDFNLIIKTGDPIIIDVRLYIEYKKERIYNSILAENKKDLLEVVSQYNELDTFLLYCTTDPRSIRAAKILCKNLNTTNIYYLDGGIKKWKKRGYSVDKTKIN